MPYPREIDLDEDTEARLISYLNQELLNHYGERSQFIEDLKTYQEDYYARPTTAKKTFPFVGAANIVIPLSAIAVEAVHAKTMTTLFALEEFVSIKLPEQYDDIRHSVELVANHTLLKDVDMYKFADNCLLELEKLGTGVGKSSWEKIERTAVREVNGKEEEFTVTVKQGATADYVPLANFLMPFTSQDPQFAAWCGEEHLETPFEVKLLCENDFFKKDCWDTLEKWVTYSQNSGGLSSDTYKQKVQSLVNQTPAWPKQIGWVEIWLSFDIDDSGVEKEIVVHYHRLAQYIMSCRYNWYEDLHRPYRHGNYITLEGRWNGIGICKQNDQFQREVTTQHRQRLDNATLANMRMIKVSKLSGYGPGEPVFPGKIWLVDDIKDIDTFQMGEIYPSSFNNESQTLNYAQQRTGINELSLGMPQVGTPGTASSDLTRVQEGKNKFDYNFKNIRRFLSEINSDAICNAAQFGFRDNRVFDMLCGKDSDSVRAFYKQPLTLLRQSLAIDISLAGQNQNKLQNRAAWTQLAGFIQQYYKGMIDLATASGNQALVQELTIAAMSGGTEAFKQILESFDTRNINRIILQQLIKPIDTSSLTSTTDPSTLLNQNAGPQAIPQSGGNNGLISISEASRVGSSPTPVGEIAG